MPYLPILESAIVSSRPLRTALYLIMFDMWRVLHFRNLSDEFVVEQWNKDTVNQCAKNY